jgi:mRNA interferase MazF
VLILARDLVRPHLTRVTVAPITSTIRGLSTEPPVGLRNGLQSESLVSVDNIVTIPFAALGYQIGFRFPDQDPALSTAIQNAFDLE